MTDVTAAESGPNGLAAVIALARAGLHVEVTEASSSAGSDVAPDHDRGTGPYPDTGLTPETKPNPL
ncbi:hypothetical protein [Devriesea agamarum]|uniref:hypothetical protein n=1 Tax=Devriesea agamarum TaxID=472569 RepID=UPI0012ED7283|nr:hypothetical protein [Devriesea agamarum]